MRIRRRHAALVTAVMAALVLTGCQQQPAPMTSMQTLVVDTADHVAAGDTTAASASLDSLEAEVTARLAEGEIDAAEADRIRAGIALLRADLAALVAPTPEPGSTESSDPVEPEPSAEPVEPAEPVAPVEPTVGETEDSDEPEESTAPGNSGPGNGGIGNSDPDKDKDKDKGKDKDKSKD